MPRRGRLFSSDSRCSRNGLRRVFTAPHLGQRSLEPVCVCDRAHGVREMGKEGRGLVPGAAAAQYPPGEAAPE